MKRAEEQLNFPMTLKDYEEYLTKEDLTDKKTVQPFFVFLEKLVDTAIHA